MTTGTITGTVTSGGSPVYNARVTAYYNPGEIRADETESIAGRQVASTRTAQDGTWSLALTINSELDSGSWYRIVANRTTYDVTVPAGTNAVTAGGIQFTPALGLSTESGRLTYAGAAKQALQAATRAYVAASVVGGQPADADLTTFAALAPTNNDTLQYVSGAWANRTVAQAKTTLALDQVDNTSNATERAATATLTNKTLTSPVVNTPTGIVKADVGLDNVNNTSNATERAATATLTNKSISGATNTLSAIPESAVTNLVTDLSTLTTNVSTNTTNITTNASRIQEKRLGAPVTAGGEYSCDKRFFLASAIPQTSGRLQLTYFVATVTETINSLKTWSGGTASSGLTLARLCVCTVAGNGDVTVIKTTTSDTTLYNTGSTLYTKALDSAWSKTAGTLYALGVLLVGSTMPTLYSDSSLGAQVGSDIRFEEPTYSAYITGLSDLPGSLTARAGLTASRQNAFFQMVP